eukprot:gene32517-44865_t
MTTTFGHTAGLHGAVIGAAVGTALGVPAPTQFAHILHCTGQSNLTKVFWGSVPSINGG